jgi:AcrR family transcriptional regulator
VRAARTSKYAPAQAATAGEGSSVAVEARQDVTPGAPDAQSPGRDEADALDALWRAFHAPDGRTTVCPSCAETRRFHRVSRRRAYACDRCGAHIYPAAGTPFCRSALPLSDWLTATAIVIESGGKVTPARLARALDVSYRTGWRMRERLVRAQRADADALQRLEPCALAWRHPSGPSAVPADDVLSPEDRIRAAACRVLAERGLSSTRVADIAREAGVSSAAIHYYFKSKDEVLLAALCWTGEQLHAGLRRLTEEPADVVTQVRRLLDMSVPSDQALHDEYLLWLEVWVRVRSHPDFLGECMRMSRQWHEAVTSVIGRGIDEGAFRPVVPLAELCDRYVAMAESLAYRSALGYEGFTPERSRQILARFTAEQLRIAPEALDG